MCCDRCSTKNQLVWALPFGHCGILEKLLGRGCITCWPNITCHLLAQHDLEVVMTNLIPLIPFVSGKSCEEGTKALVSLLGEALEAQETASKRANELKQFKPKGLMELFTPEKRNVVEKGKGSIKKGNSQKEHQHQQQQQQEGAPVSPKKTRTPTKRARKASEKVLGVASDDEEEEVKRPKKQGKSGSKKKDIKIGGGTWNGDEYPRITKVTKCDEGADGLRIEVHAKKQGRGQWQKVLFSLDSTQLGSIDALPQNTKNIVKVSFQKAVTSLYGQKWPNALRLALAGMTWTKEIVPAADGDGASGYFAGLDDPNANINFSHDVE